MRYISYAVLALAFAAGIASKAETVENEAGSLSQKIEDPANVTTLFITGSMNAEDFAFIADKMDALTSLNIGAVTIDAYSGDVLPSGFNSVTANQLPPYALFGAKIKSVTLPSSITSIGEYALASTDITSIAIPANVTSIGRGAFASTPLQKVIVPENVTSLSTAVFKDCKSLQNVTLPASIQSIPAQAFANCSNLSQIATSASLSSIGNEAFMGCSALSSFDFPTSVSSIGEKAFYNTGLASANLQNLTNLTSLGNFALASCPQLTEAHLPEQLTTIGNGVFMGDSRLTNVSVSSKITLIPAYTYSGIPIDSVYTTSAVPNSVASIGDYALNGWSAIEAFRLPDNLTSIGDGAMAGWTSLQELYATELTEVPETGSDVWEGVDQSDAILFVSHAYAPLFKDAAQWQDFKIDDTTSVDEVITDAAKSQIDYCLVDNTLVINSKGSEIVSVSVFDMAGRRHLSKTGADFTVTVNTTGWTPGVYVVSSVLADGTAEAAKIKL